METGLKEILVQVENESKKVFNEKITGYFVNNPIGYIAYLKFYELFND